MQARKELLEGITVYLEFRKQLSENIRPLSALPRISVELARIKFEEMRIEETIHKINHILNDEEKNFDHIAQIMHDSQAIWQSERSVHQFWYELTRIQHTYHQLRIFSTMLGLALNRFQDDILRGSVSET